MKSIFIILSVVVATVLIGGSAWIAYYSWGVDTWAEFYSYGPILLLPVMLSVLIVVMAIDGE